MECFICEYRLDRRPARGNWPSACRAGRVSCCRVHDFGGITSACVCCVHCVAVAEDGQARRAALLASVKRGEVRLLLRLSG
jgi:hypothetical protein